MKCLKNKINEDTNNLFNFDCNAKNSILDCVYNYIIGVDEAGRGPGAGPVYTAAVCFKDLSDGIIKELSKLNDSKQLTEQVREELYPIILEHTFHSVNSSDEKMIDEVNIYNATSNAMKNSCEDVIRQIKGANINVLTLVDGKVGIRGYRYPQTAVVKGDAKSASIAAASILAKVSRDKYMCNLNEKYPRYGWDKNKGYLTKEHIEAIKKYGPSPYHRMTFLKNILNRNCKEIIIQKKLF